MKIFARTKERRSRDSVNRSCCDWQNIDVDRNPAALDAGGNGQVIWIRVRERMKREICAVEEECGVWRRTRAGTGAPSQGEEIVWERIHLESESSGLLQGEERLLSISKQG